MDSLTLWTDNEPIARACLAHPFVTGIADGTLGRPAFEHYVGQDAYFLEAFARAYAMGLARSSDSTTMGRFKVLLDGAMEELQLHSGYARRWGVDLQPEPTDATRAYTDFLAQVAVDEPLGNLCAAMTPCMRLYAWLGQSLEPTASATSPYIEWVTTYASAEFESLAASMEALMDDLVEASADAGARYREAMTLELAFFDSAHAIGGVSDLHSKGD